MMHFKKKMRLGCEFTHSRARIAMFWGYNKNGRNHFGVALCTQDSLKRILKHNFRC